MEFEQYGNARATYGEGLLRSLSKRLTLQLGKGYGRSNLQNMRRLYLYYPKCQTVSGKLSWSHWCELLELDDSLERQFYENECMAQKWGVRTLRRQIDSGLFMRIAQSHDKKGVLELAEKGQIIRTPQDVVKDTFVLDFLGIPKEERMQIKKIFYLPFLSPFTIFAGSKRCSGLIGNEVKFFDSPAAVSSIFRRPPLPLRPGFGKARSSGTSQKTCRFVIVKLQ